MSSSVKKKGNGGFDNLRLVLYSSGRLLNELSKKVLQQATNIWRDVEGRKPLHNAHIQYVVL